MKKMKLAAIFAGLVSVFTFSSCLNDGDSGPNYDLYEIVTVEDGSIFGGPVLKGDAWGYTYTPVASSVLAGLKGHDDLTSSPPSSRLSLAVSLECPAYPLATKNRGCARCGT